MDIGTIIRNQVKVDRMERFGQSPQLSLGELIAKLEAVPRDAPVVLATGETPGELRSWRGSYDELALEPTADTARTVGEVLSELVGAIGRTFRGYKGGDFVMGRHTPVWVAPWGTAGDDAVVGVARDGDRVVIETAAIEF